MIRTLLIALVVVALALVGYYYFSGKRTGDVQVIDNTSSSSSPSASAASTAKPAPDEKSPPATGEFWTKRCDKHCEIFQRLTITETKQRLLEFAVGYPEEMKGSAQAVIVLPLGIVVSQGIGLSVDGAAPAQAAVRTCGAEGCIAIISMPDDFLATMKSGKVMTVSFFDAGSGKKINVEMSLSGFGEKLDKLKS